MSPEVVNAVNQMIARLEGRPPPPPVGGGDLPAGHPPVGSDSPAVGPAVAQAPPGGSPLQVDVESLLRGHSIFGPKVVSMSWDTETQGKVFVSGFPMDQMPPRHA